MCKNTNLKCCPWCKQLPSHKKLKCCQDFDDAGNSYPKLTILPSEIIECANPLCKVRPRLERVNTNDAVSIWNMWE